MPLLTTVIGAFPKPDFVPWPDWFAKGSGLDRNENIYTHSRETAPVALLDKATREVIQEQMDLGLDIITDGEVIRQNYIFHFCRLMAGFDFSDMKVIPIRGGATNTIAPTIKAKIEPDLEPWVAQEWSRAQALTTTPVKMTIPGPMTIVNSTLNVYYKDIETLSADLVRCINKQILGLAQAGCKYIQIDEPLLVRDPEAALKYGIDNLEKCFEGVGGDVQRIVHMCCGYPNYLDQEDFEKADKRCYHTIADKLDKANFDAVSLEDAHRHNDLDLFSKFKQKTVILGVVAVARSQVETEEEIRDRVKQVLTLVPSERLVLAPDCGLGYLPRDVLKKKLTNMVKVAKCLP